MHIALVILTIYLVGVYGSIIILLWRDKMIRRQYHGRFPLHLDLLDERQIIINSLTSWVLLICFIGALCVVPRSQWWRASNAPRRRP